ncbi:hypothetical protein AGMMS50248_08020 [Deltaproteobacteria bacterium]|nr:hypothetical protein AGMMS50248_08020 [Deltaproteobacteria bacterium]
MRFSKEFFGNIKVINPDRDITPIQLEYKYTVESYRHIAAYEVDGKVLNILAVKLKFGRNVERARSMQRSFVSKFLTVPGHDGAVVAFYTGNDPFWRLSFIRLDYEFATGRAKMSLTPAKRYSYLVGEKEPCHTAMEQLYPIFRDENYRPIFDKIEEAFSVERVTKEFFEKYKKKYFILKEHLDSNAAFCDEAKRHGFTSEQFAKKMMGQLAFLYFLQKKGWLGVKVLPHVLTDKEYKKAFYKSKSSREIIPLIYQASAANGYKLISSALLSRSDKDADIAASCFIFDDQRQVKGEYQWGQGEKTFVRHLFTIGFPKGLPFGRTANCDTIPLLSVETGGKKAPENAKEKCKKPTGKMKILQQAIMKIAKRKSENPLRKIRGCTQKNRSVGPGGMERFITL